MPRNKRPGVWRDTTIRITPETERGISDIRALSYRYGHEPCRSASDAVELAVQRFASELNARLIEATRQSGDK